MTELSARAVALDLLEAVLDRRQALDHALEAIKDLQALDARDRGFARLLAATTLRRLGTLDRAIDAALERPAIPSVARHILRLGLVQLRYLGTPPHAALSATVELATRRIPGMKGLVNAVLRRHESLPFVETGEANLPPWLWGRWTAAYGAEGSEALADAFTREAPLDITARDPGAWAGALEAETMPLGTLRRLSGGPVETLPGFGEGAWWVQDLSASLPVKLMGNIAGRTVFDLCAAPGGKTAQLCAAGGIVTALDRSPQRVKRLKANLERLRLDATIKVADAASWHPGEGGLADAILLDAPCLATGTIRRHPDIPWLKTEQDLRALVATQARLLRHAATLVRPGGQLVYCTCSLEPDEGEGQVAAFVAGMPGWTREPVREDELPGLCDMITAEGDVRALPTMLAGRGGVDGFYVARLRQGG